mmetsp:Transcript_92796/g.288886  ORF Transcript_92796/g.288886 Transcript_92796/m.288886 type:complete len:239 (-) Transcript_92796:425-1141(-)
MRQLWRRRHPPRGPAGRQPHDGLLTHGPCVEAVAGAADMVQCRGPQRRVVAALAASEDRAADGLLAQAPALHPRVLEPGPDQVLGHAAAQQRARQGMVAQGAARPEHPLAEALERPRGGVHAVVVGVRRLLQAQPRPMPVELAADGVLRGLRRVRRPQDLAPEAVPRYMHRRKLHGEPPHAAGAGATSLVRKGPSPLRREAVDHEDPGAAAARNPRDAQVLLQLHNGASLPGLRKRNG